ncbi:MAG TPA: DoxX family protein [Polyangia bacterium]|nr:DoxX family protein [Polyangia bacterium]
MAEVWQLRMNPKSVAYWIATVLIAAETLAGGGTDLAHGRSGLVAGTPVVDVVTSLGYPIFVLTILGVWKVLGGATLLAPGLPRLKEWAYAGIVFELTAAAASLLVRGYGVGDVAPPLVLAALALTSWALRPPSRMLGSVLPGRPTQPSRELVA